MLKMAGMVEQGKWKDEYLKGERPTPTVPQDWIDKSYGDNPIDHDMIKKGFSYWNGNPHEIFNKKTPWW